RPRHHRGRPPRRPTGGGMTDVTLTNIIAGEETGAAGRMELVDPATGEVYGTAPRSSAADVDAAVTAAARAFAAWRRTTPAERQRLLLRLADLVEARADELLDAEVRSTGKPRERSEEHTSELQSRENLVCRLLLEKKNSQALHQPDRAALDVAVP